MKKNDTFEQRLRALPWNEMMCAYGSSEEVPDQIMALFSKDKEECEDAISELSGNIHHQGTIYFATAYAVPFLIEAITLEECKCKMHIFFLLGAIYDGIEANEIKYFGTNVNENIIKKDASDEVEKGLPVFVDYLKRLNKEEIEELEEDFEALYFYERTDLYKDEDGENEKFVIFLAQSSDFRHFFTNLKNSLNVIRQRIKAKYSIKKEISLWEKIKSFFKI